MNPSDRSTEDDIEKWLAPTLEKEGLESYKINISGKSEKGDNYLGEITFVEVSGRTKTNEEKVYNFVIKSAKKSKEYRDLMPIKEAFANEIFFYEEIFPTFLKFQQEKGVQEPFRHAAKCYGTLILEDMEVLILENMVKKGYSLHDRRRPMTKELIKEVIQNYGKLHAVSFALREQKPEVFEKLSKDLHDIFKLINAKQTPRPDASLFQHVRTAAKEVNEDTVVEKCFTLDKIILENFNKSVPADSYAVILHGDCWNNNFLFKFSDEQTPILSEACLIDFQLTRLASPVYDLSYFLFTCLSGDDVESFDEINGWYYESLSNSLREMGGDPDKLFPFEELMNQWKKFSLFGIMMMTSIVKLCLSETDEVPDLVEAAESDVDLAATFMKGIRNTEEFRNRTIPLMKFAIDRNFI